MGEPVRIVELAENMIRLSGKRPYEDVDIAFTGIRPGEKLHEALLSSEEISRVRSLDKMMICAPVSIDWTSFSLDLDLLVKAATNGDEEETRTMLHKVIPGYPEGAAGSDS